VRIGLLQCGTVGSANVAVAGDYDRLFADLLATVDPEVELVVHRVGLGEQPSSTADADAWLITGSRHSVYEELDWIVELGRFTERLLAAERPLVGSCFGHQMVASVLGAPVEPVGFSIGAVDYRLTGVPPGEDGTGPADITLVAVHQDQVLELPDGATLLATAPTCPVAAFTVGPRVLAVQPHPEFGPELAASIYRSDPSRFAGVDVDGAIAGLARPLDRRRVAAWILATALS
jgi:GMP synthase-like glutamine amidotransferase